MWGFRRVLACFPDRFHVEIYIVPDGFYVESVRFLEVSFVLSAPLGEVGWRARWLWVRWGRV